MEHEQEQERNHFIKIVDEHLESHDNSRKAAQDKLHEICEGMRKQIDDLENSINKEMEELFNKEDKRLQSILNDLRENTSADEVSKVIQKAKTELLVMQSYEIIKCNFNNSNGNNDDENKLKIIFSDEYKLKTERQLTSLKLIDFEGKNQQI